MNVDVTPPITNIKVRHATAAAKEKLTMELAMKMNGLIFYPNKFAIDASFEPFKFVETRQL